jgi:hypothetical protein
MAQGIQNKRSPKGTKNRKTVLLQEKGRKTLAEVLGANAFDGDAHSLPIAILQGREYGDRLTPRRRQGGHALRKASAYRRRAFQQARHTAGLN